LLLTERERTEKERERDGLEVLAMEKGEAPRNSRPRRRTGQGEFWIFFKILEMPIS
jgi:hypothetical protein